MVYVCVIYMTYDMNRKILCGRRAYLRRRESRMGSVDYLNKSEQTRYIYLFTDLLFIFGDFSGKHYINNIT